MSVTDTVACLGDINIDVLLDVDGLPARGAEVFSRNRSETLGGSAVNTAVVLTRLGVPSAVMGAVGADNAGDRALARLASIGVSTGLTRRVDSAATAMNTILVTPDGERTMIGSRGANVHYEPPAGWAQGVKWLHVSGYALMEGTQQASALAGIDLGRRHEIPMSLDVPAGVGAAIGRLLSSRLSLFSLISGSRDSLSELTGSSDPIGELTRTGPCQVAMTSGAGPVVVADPEGSTTVRPPKVASVDATGAGDAFMAGLIAAKLGDLKSGPMTVLATAAGAAATLVTGASETLADPSVWHRVLEPERWDDINSEWLARASSVVTGSKSDVVDP